jgi:hypothetical protein
MSQPGVYSTLNYRNLGVYVIDYLNNKRHIDRIALSLSLFTGDPLIELGQGPADKGEAFLTAIEKIEKWF